MNYNFSNADGLNYENLPFNTTPINQGYESSVCIIPQLQALADTMRSIDNTLLYLAFVSTLVLALQVLAYLKTKRQT